MNTGFDKEKNRHDEIMDGIVLQIKTYIELLPDNPDIRRLGGHCKTMSFSNLASDNWDVVHYDFKKQYELVIKDLERGSKDMVMTKLKRIVDTRTVLDGNRVVKLHSDVVNNLGEIK